MSEAYPDPTNGAVALPTGHGADINSFRINETYFTETVAAYGSGVYDPYRSSGTPHMSTDSQAFAKYGAAGKSPGFGAATAAGSSATFTIDTGVTITGVHVIRSITLDHGRLRAAVPLAFGTECGGDQTVTWPVS